MRHILNDFGFRKHLQLFLLSSIFTLSVWRTPGRWRDELKPCLALWSNSFSVYMPGIGWIVFLPAIELISIAALATDRGDDRSRFRSLPSAPHGLERNFDREFGHVSVGH